MRLMSNILLFAIAPSALSATFPRGNETLTIFRFMSELERAVTMEGIHPKDLQSNRQLRRQRGTSKEEGKGAINEENGNTRRLCVRALKLAHGGAFEKRIPETSIEVTTSCISCSPTRPVNYCHSACQDYINKVYAYCNGICLPENFYYTPGKSLMGCWSDVVDQMKYEVERCGCNSALSRAPPFFGSTLFFLVCASYALVFRL